MESNSQKNIAIDLKNNDEEIIENLEVLLNLDTLEESDEWEQMLKVSDFNETVSIDRPQPMRKDN